MQLLNRRRMMGIHKVLPYDSEIEYLQTDGTQYVDTGCIPNNTNEFEVNFTYLGDNGQNQAIIGARNSDQQSVSASVMSLSIWLGSYDRYAANDKGYDSGWLGNLSVNARYTLSIKNRSIYRNDVFKWSAYTSVVYRYTNTTVGLFRSHGTNNFWDPRPGHKLKFYYAKIYDNGQLVRDYIPVRVGQTGYLYDKVSGTLFGNQGTGNFTLGPDVLGGG